MRTIKVALLMGSLLVALAACGNDEPQARSTAMSSFEKTPGERVFEAYRQTGGVTRTVMLPEGSREILVQLDCTGTSGQVYVTFLTFGAAGAGCSPVAGERGTVVSLVADRSLIDRRQTMTITAPADQQWSVAVDAGAKITSDF